MMDRAGYVIRYISKGASNTAVIAVALNAAARLVPGVGESKISNKLGSGKANVAAIKLLNQVSIPSNNTEYMKVEFVPKSQYRVFSCVMIYLGWRMYVRRGELRCNMSRWGKSRIYGGDLSIFPMRLLLSRVQRESNVRRWLERVIAKYSKKEKVR